ncbi:MAG: hypothetical protein Q7K29_06660 [Thermoleophilia bacterium]|nr:hypothetical protein [Thermoleophilia bacterium]
MISPTLAKHLRENHEEVMRRWLENLHGHIADDFEQMLKTPMGSGVANKLLNCAIDFLEAEDYQKADVLHGVRDIASDASFRRTAVGFGLPDIVATAIAFRLALQETLLEGTARGSVENERALTDVVMAINELGDVLVSGEIAGYFAYNNYREDKADEDAA